MPAYNSSLFDPPAPLARVEVRNLGTGARLAKVPMLLDSGADVTLVPRSALDQIKVRPTATEAYELVSFDGTTSLAASAKLDLVFLKRTFRGRYLALDRDYGILGRDVLNRVCLHLDGPSLIWTETSSIDV